MKKKLLLGSYLLIGMSVFSQNVNQKIKPTGKIDYFEKAQKNASIQNREEFNVPFKSTTKANNQKNEVPNVASKTNALNSWSVIAGSMNIYGVLVSQSRPLQYNDDLNAVSYIHRKSTSYNPAANGNSGSILAEISTNWGTTWDSTCIWANATNLARYPQGGIYNNSSTNTNNSMSSAYIVGSGPVTTGSGWVGNWYASKQLGAGNYNNAASLVNNAMQFMTTVPSNTAVGKCSFSRISFSPTDDGKVRSIGAINGDEAGTTFATLARRGAAVVKGTFNSGVFNWSSDSIICAAAFRTDGGKSMGGQPQMAWNESGTVGYVVFIGSRAGATGSNKAWQPIVYKTTNSGGTWALLNGIDFNDPSMNPIKSHIPAIWSSNLPSTPVLPTFNTSEGLGLTVDFNNKLHIVSTIVGCGSNNVDSITAGYSFDQTEKYSWNHSPGDRPYVYDFIGDGSAAWTYVTVDSLSTEGPASASGDPGFDENPWDVDAGNKVTSDSRIQAGRTPDGKFILYSWAESDTNFTNSAKKWNSLPNIHARCLDVTTGSVSPTEVIISQSSAGVSSRAMFHYMSSTSGSATLVGVTTPGTGSVTMNMPFTVANSLPYSQLTNNKHWFNAAGLTFKLGNTASPTMYKCLSGNCAPNATGTYTSMALCQAANCAGVGLNEYDFATTSVIFPNPTKNNATLLINLIDNDKVELTLFNLMGQLVKTVNAQGQAGENNIGIDLNGLTSGIYLVTVKAHGFSSTKKLVIE